MQVNRTNIYNEKYGSVFIDELKFTRCLLDYKAFKQDSKYRSHRSRPVKTSCNRAQHSCVSGWTLSTRRLDVIIYLKSSEVLVWILSQRCIICGHLADYFSNNAENEPTVTCAAKRNDQELFLAEQYKHLQVLRELHNWTKAIELIIYFVALC